MRCAPQVEAKFGNRLPSFESRARHALSEPPLPEIFPREPSRRDVVLHLHGRHIRTSKTFTAHAQQQIGHFLTEHEAATRTAQIRTKSADALEHVATDSHVRPERHLPFLVVNERLRAVVLDRDGAPEMSLLEIEPARRCNLPDWTHRSACIHDRFVL